jgi:Rrf2 family protein
MAASTQFAISIHVLAILAKQNGGQMVKSEEIAASVNTNPVVIRRLLCNLQQANLVISQKGATGGTRLAKKADEIKLDEIYEAVVPGDVFALHRQKPSQKCPVGKNIESILCHLQKEIDRAIEEKLVKYSLADVLRSVETGEIIFSCDDV